jgi:hypothetical protein
MEGRKLLSTRRFAPLPAEKLHDGARLMIYVVEFVDGTTARIDATSGNMATSLAVAKFKDKLVIGVKKAGLLDMAQRQPPVEVQKSS